MKSVRCSVPEGQDVSRDKICRQKVIPSVVYRRGRERALRGSSIDENSPDFHGAKTYRATSIYYHAKYEHQLRRMEISSGAGAVWAGQGVEVETQCGSTKSWGRYHRVLPRPDRLPR